MRARPCTDRADAAAIVRSFPPIASPDACILVLGSMPGAASLAAGRYYAHPQNAFWRIMGALVGAGPDRDYDERQRILKARGIAVWDVLRSCVRPSSLDSDICNESPNDFATFFGAHPHIRRIGLNGGKAASSFRKYVAPLCPAQIEVVALPSTSPAHAARSFEQKCALWRDKLGL